MDSENVPPRKVRVELGARSYDVLIGRGLLDRMKQALEERGLSGTRVTITDEKVGELYFEKVRTAVTNHPSTIAYRARGESSKSLETYGKILSDLASERIPRSAIIIGLGGGVIGDLAGFVAATYLRGINFVQVPTTLLAMVDSSVGGKTGVNLPEGKNLVGVFHQPRLVVADLDTLATLPPREFAAGMAEVIKCGAIRDRALFERVAAGVTPQDVDLAEIVEKCVAIKARIVENDEFETKGERALLNFGHTIGHAIEKATGYTRYLHGEAIALGMRAAAWLSVWEAGLPEDDARAIEAALRRNGLPLELDPAADRSAIFSALGNDKKVAADGGLRWVLLRGVGQASSGCEIPIETVGEALSKLS